MAEQLSLQVQAVLDAYRSSHLSINNLAAAVEALADQVVPHRQQPATSPHMGNFVSHAQWFQRQVIRHQLLAIAAELRGQDQPSSEEL